LQSDDATVLALAKGRAASGDVGSMCAPIVRSAGRCCRRRRWHSSRDRGGEHSPAHLADHVRVFQAAAFGGDPKLYEADRKPGPLVKAACRVHARRKAAAKTNRWFLLNSVQEMSPSWWSRIKTSPLRHSRCRL